MGTKAKCIKCGRERWVNTKKLHHIRTELNIKPSDWLKKRYICRDCKKRINLIKESTTESIVDKLNQFSIDCRTVFAGYFFGKQNEAILKLREKLLKNDIRSYTFIKYRNVIVGVEVQIPVIGKFMVQLFV